uniref:Uncharacterized protein n=1 Tax=Sphaerodactylus townsendi TaxID=933632 RepID=A0ACB8G4L9_9SAUR
MEEVEELNAVWLRRPSRAASARPLDELASRRSPLQDPQPPRPEGSLSPARGRWRRAARHRNKQEKRTPASDRDPKRGRHRAAHITRMCKRRRQASGLHLCAVEACNLECPRHRAEPLPVPIGQKLRDLAGHEEPGVAVVHPVGLPSQAPQLAPWRQITGSHSADEGCLPLLSIAEKKSLLRDFRLSAGLHLSADGSLRLECPTPRQRNAWSIGQSRAGRGEPGVAMVPDHAAEDGDLKHLPVDPTSAGTLAWLPREMVGKEEGTLYISGSTARWVAHLAIADVSVAPQRDPFLKSRRPGDAVAGLGSFCAAQRQ